MSTYPKYLREFACFDDISHEKIEKIAQFSDAVCYGFQSLRSMINCVHSGHYSKKNLSRTDIAGCFFSTDMLLPGL